MKSEFWGIVVKESGREEGLIVKHNWFIFIFTRVSQPNIICENIFYLTAPPYLLAELFDPCFNPPSDVNNPQC